VGGIPNSEFRIQNFDIRYTRPVVHALADLISWLGPHALILALALPPVIRIVGHWIPEELFMVAMGVLAARSETPQAAALILGAVMLSHFATDQIVYLGGRWLRPRLGRFPRIETRLAAATDRLTGSPGALLGLIPARVLPLGRGAWLAACGVVRTPWPHFAAVDLTALLIHLGAWSGLGWWLAGDLRRLAASAETGRIAGVWMAITLVTAATAVILWRSRDAWQPRTMRAVRRAGRPFRRSDHDSPIQ
jgi:membrane protein DedA with SNARE-associated domain